MSRPAKLTDVQCLQARVYRKSQMPVARIAKAFDVSESTMYKVLDGSYTPRKATKQTGHAATPSLFFKDQGIDTDLVLAAARLIVANAEMESVRH